MSCQVTAEFWLLRAPRAFPRYKDKGHLNHTGNQCGLTGLTWRVLPNVCVWCRIKKWKYICRCVYVHNSMRVSAVYICVHVNGLSQSSRMQAETFPWPWVSPNTFHWRPHTALGCLYLDTIRLSVYVQTHLYSLSVSFHGRLPGNKDVFSMSDFNLFRQIELP